MVFNYTLYQMKNETIQEKKYQMLDKLIEKFGKVDKNDYEKTYSDTIEDIDKDQTLDNLYYKFNVIHPKDFTGRSMSVGDVVELEDAITHELNFYYCDLIGFKKIDFLNLEEVN